jgi:hypothetical protein
MLEDSGTPSLDLQFPLLDEATLCSSSLQRRRNLKPNNPLLTSRKLLEVSLPADGVHWYTF